MLKITLNSMLIILLSSFFLSAQNPKLPVPQSLTGAEIQLPQAFPTGQYTPHGYIDNPWHSMVFNRSGVIRSLSPLGFGYWKRQFWGSYGEGPRGHVNYLSLLHMSVVQDGLCLFDAADFQKNNLDLYSSYHTKNMMSYNWSNDEVRFSYSYFLPRENTLACLVNLENSSDQERKISLHATSIYGDWEIKWWGSNGLSTIFHPEADYSVMKIWAYGDIFVLASDWQSDAHKSTGSAEQWKDWIRKNDFSSSESASVKGSGPVYTTHSFQIELAPHQKKQGIIYLCRGVNEKWTLNELEISRREALGQLKIQLAEDENFWQSCPKLAGDWPDAWKHGWVYDWETLRMNIRQPIGIFNHPWDAMQIHSPRVVLGETCLDMLTYQYADPELAKDVIYGTFADAVMPNIPCTREDGSMNMIGADGSECGTAPMWGFPFHVIRIIYAQTGDREWISKLYPHLKAYLEWWLKNRTDMEGWFHCNNSWESGQDGSRRFPVEGEGDPATFVRTVDVEASVAEAMKIMAEFAPIAGKSDDKDYWTKLADRRIKNTRSMFVDGWFRDIDGRNGQPIIFEDWYDVIMLAPLTCGIANQDQVQAIKPKFDFFVQNPEWLQWPPGLLAFSEAAWFAGKQNAAAEAVKNIANRVYQRTDSQTVMFIRDEDPFSYRIPGVANEFWPNEFRPAGGENYGWGATLPGYIIRHIMGYRESDDTDESAFIVAPSMPAEFMEAGKIYSLKDLTFRNLKFDLIYQIEQNDTLLIALNYKMVEFGSLQVSDKAGNRIVVEKNQNTLKFSGKNNQIYLVYLP